MRKILFFLLFFMPISSFSQERSFHNYYWNYTENYFAFIGVTNCYVRENPSTTSTLLDSLQIGKKIKVIKTTENDLRIKGLNVSWLEIEYTNKAGILSKGFLWKGFTAIGNYQDGDITYLTTIDKFEKKHKPENYDVEAASITVKVLDKNNIVLNQKTIQKNIAESDYFEGTTIGSLGLKNLKNIYRISFNGEACGIPSLYYYFGWNGKELLLLPEKYNVGDAGIFYHSEKFIFPKEKGGKPDLIFKEIEEGENDDETGEKETYIFDVTKYVETYKWNGEKAVFVSKSKQKKFKRNEN